MTTRVVIGCSSQRDYQFLAVLTGMIWRDVIGIEPFFLMTGDWQDTKRGAVAEWQLFNNKFRVAKVAKSEKYSEATVAQNCRQHAAISAEFESDDWIMPSDVDLWPIRKDFYFQHLKHPKARAICYYANGDHYQTLPTCHVVMKALTWRQVYGLDPAKAFIGQIEDTITRWLPERKFWKDNEGFAIWMSDQAIMTDKLRAQPWFQAEAAMIERKGHPPVDRIDRGGWPNDIGDLSAWTDAHLLRPADVPENWTRVRELFKKILPNKIEWADQYRDEYWEAYNG